MWTSEEHRAWGMGRRAESTYCPQLSAIGRKLIKESKLIAKESMFVLSEFEALNDEGKEL